MNLRVPVDVKEAVLRAADDDVRTMSSMAVKIMREWLTQRSYLPATGRATKPKSRRKGT
jgi:hypothetical protein